MWLYYLKLSLLSIKKTPVLSTLMVLATAVGIGACLTTFSAFSVIANNPMSHKNDSLFSIQLDAWDPDSEYDVSNNIPHQLTYQDAVAVTETDIADKSVVMTRTALTVQRVDGTGQASREDARATSGDFFSMFDVEFLYGGSWQKSADLNTEKVTIISEAINLKFFDGQDSIGQAILLQGESFVVVGVVDGNWRQTPNVYDLNNGPFGDPDDVYIPFSQLENKRYPSRGNTRGWQFEDISFYPNLLRSELVWVQAWVELSSEAQFNEYSQFIENYISQQKQLGRFQRPARYLLSSPQEWLDINEVISEDNQVLLLISITFLVVCLVNTIVLLLAKFLRKAPEAGIRRALGASRQAIFSQHLFEALIIGLLGGLFGLAFSWLGLAGVRALYGNDADQIAMFSVLTVIMSFVFALAASLFSGILPAWKISHTQPASYLKTQ